MDLLQALKEFTSKEQNTREGTEICSQHILESIGGLLTTRGSTEPEKVSAETKMWFEMKFLFFLLWLNT